MRRFVWLFSIGSLLGIMSSGDQVRAQMLYSFESGSTEGWTASIIPDSAFDDTMAELSVERGPGNTDGEYSLKVIGASGNFKRSAGVLLGAEQLAAFNEAVLQGWNLQFDWTIVAEDNPGATGYTAQIAMSHIGPTTGWTQGDLYASTDFPVWDASGSAIQTMSPSIPLSNFGGGTLGFSGIALDGQAQAIWLAFGLGSANETNETRTFYLDNFRLVNPHLPSLAGDFNLDGIRNAPDIDLLTQALADGSNDSKFDVNQDQLVDGNDRTFWIKSLRRTYMGDSNLDGVFNSTDFIEIFSIGEYEDGVPHNSGWLDGDWDGNREFDSGDFVAAFIDGGYEKPPIAEATASVPEPSLSLSLSLIGISGSVFRLTRTKRRRSPSRY